MQQRPIVLSRLGESQPGVDDQLCRIDARGHRVVDAGEQLGAHFGHHVVVMRGLDAGGPTTPTASASTPTARRLRPPAAPSPGSARPPETSLTIRAPLCSAARATSACMVSMLTVMPCAASSLTTGTTRDASTRGSIRAAPGRVDSPPTSTIPAPSAAIARPCCDGAVGIEIAPAVRERVVSDVQNPHNLHRAPDSLTQDEVERFGSRSGTGFELTAHRRRRGDGAGLADTAHRHAQVLGLDDDDHPATDRACSPGRRRSGW